MGALRKAGVWLGLIEDDDDYPDRGYDHRGYDDYEDDEEEVAPIRPRAGERAVDTGRGDLSADTGRPHSRLAEALRNESLRAESRLAESRLAEARLAEAHAEPVRPEPPRSVVRPVTRTSAATIGSDTGSSYPIRDNLALTPQVVARERPMPVEPPAERRYQITTLHPTTYHEARTIGEHFRDGVPVIMNLTEMAEADARRLVDFAAGLAFGLRGSMERVTNRVFLLSPANVQVTPEDKRKIAEGGFLPS